MLKVVLISVGVIFALLTLATSASLSRSWSSQGTLAMFIYMLLAGAFLLAGYLKHEFDKEDTKVKGLNKAASRAKQVTSDAENNAKIAQDLAMRLRELASNVEDLSINTLLKIENIQIEKVTSSTRVRANSHLLLSRSGFRIPYISNNSRTGKILEIKKAWTNIAGCTKDDYVLYLSTTSAIYFYPSAKESLYFNIVWQAFADAMNDGGHAFLEPKKHQIGERLRAAARLIQEEYSQSRMPLRIKLPEVTNVLKAAVPVPEVHGPFEFSKPPTEGDVIGKYQLAKRLGGQSGQGAVYKAK